MLTAVLQNSKVHQQYIHIHEIAYFDGFTNEMDYWSRLERTKPSDNNKNHMKSPF